jgi:hypothetical protein
MPVERGYTTRDGERVGYYRWGESGKMYTYEPGDEEEREEARRKAERQMRAAYASGYSG